MNYQKISSALALLLAVSLALGGCGAKPAESSAVSAAPEAGAAPASSAASSDSAAPAERQTSAEKKVVNIGAFDKACESPIVVTSVGQSADVSMLDALMKKVDAQYTFNSTATAADIAEAKTVIIASGASSKGLGAAGISADDEKARAKELLQACKDKGITVIAAHLGGSARRGALSDEFTDMVLESSDYIIVVEDGNNDGKFTKFAEDKSLPITLLNSIADCMEPLKALFAAK